jgi:hypothetical protein
MWTTVDPDGRPVVLGVRGWSHIVETHPQLNVEPEAVLGVVARPDRRLAGRDPGEEWFYRQGIGPSGWVKVVVHYEHDRGLLVTAFPRRSFP